MVSLQPQLSLPKGSQNGTGKPIFIWLLKCYSWARFFFFFFSSLSFTTAASLETNEQKKQPMETGLGNDKHQEAGS